MSRPTITPPPGSARAIGAGPVTADPLDDDVDLARRRAAARRRRIFRRRRTVAVAILLVVVGLGLWGGVYTSNALNAPLPVASPEVSQPAPVVAPAQAIAGPQFGTWAISAVGFPGPLAQSADQTPLPTASITKVITALVILDQHPIAPGEEGPSIEYTDADVDVYWDMVAQNGSVAPVPAGSSLTLKQSLETMLLPSGNNYAISLSNWAFGSEQGLVDAARGWLDAHGLVHTTIADSSGLSLDNTSIPSDLVQLGVLALENPVLAEIVAMQSAEIPGVGTVTNSNKMLGTHGVDGIKTGTTDDAANLLFSADYPVGSHTVTVVGVVLGGETHAVLDEAIGALLDSVAPGFHEVTALTAGQELASYAQPWGDTAVARAGDGASVVVWSDTPVEVEVTADALATAADGQSVGTATVRAGDATVTVPLVLEGALADPGDWWRLTNPDELDAAEGTRPRPAASSGSVTLACY
ncbi:D-alanyl-D-alanine carboxypeptidase [Agromyces intestinalis]|uniref:D-alanyl-D-alanine carboxypeptidase n=1 Tax=Agromyces intestinalis TaxID=2592652 RepID=A0A5C1YJ10_9MICO|nr:D-alanyl-D-alanine carboxypeptidase [Agromyces intestinalis]QEO15973.1 D-alanyl-D-alanine carboxypeptidase [Agromyces intestinalis]